MKKLNLKEIQKLEFDILIYFSDICKEYGLRYGLTSGTLLGAVRHKGFIPWDDDIDVVMPRPDYIKFIEIMETRHGRYKVKTPYKELDYIYEYAKLINCDTVLIEDPDGLNFKMSVYIDVFPVDGLPENINHQRRTIKKIKKIQRIYSIIVRAPYKVKYVHGVKREIWYVLLLLKKLKIDKIVLKVLDFKSMKYKFDESKYCAVLTGQGMKEVFSYEEYSLKGKVVFEGREFRTYTHPEKYLQQFFGDYMKLPPYEQRQGHNNLVWME